MADEADEVVGVAVVVAVVLEAVDAQGEVEVEELGTGLLRRHRGISQDTPLRCQTEMEMATCNCRQR